MPDRDGFELVEGLQRRREHVLHHPCDRYVPNKPRAKREHLIACNRGARSRAAAEQAARDYEAALLERVSNQLTIEGDE